MSDQAIGTARIDVVVDTSQFDVAIDRAKNRTASMTNAAQQEYAKLDRVEKRRVDRLIDQANKISLTREQQLAYDAALRTSGTLLDEVTRKIARNTAAQQASGAQLGISAKQTQAALRGVPAQITDIFTSLQGGQRPITVLLQQGGQLKDMFGGIRPAASALGSTLLGMVNPTTLLAGAGVALIAAWHGGAEESIAYNRALIETGGYAGRTANELRGLAQDFDNLAGVTESSASKAIAAVASTGRFAGEQLDQVSRAAVEWSTATGESVDDVVARFVKLSDDPVKAILELNKSQHFLTEETIKQIDSLVEQGNQVDAARIAIETYAQTLQDRASKIVPNLGLIEKGWKAIRDSAKEAWDGMLNIGRDPTLAELQKRLDGFQRALAGPGLLQADRNDLQKRVRDLKAQMAPLQAQLLDVGINRAFESTVNSDAFARGKKEEEERQRQLEQFRNAETRYLTDSQKKLREKAEVQDLLTKGVITQADATKRLAQIDESYARKAAGGSKTNPTDSIIARLRQQIALNDEQAKSEDKLTASERLMVQVRTELEKLGIKALPADRKLIDSLLERLKASGDLAAKTQDEIKAKEQLLRLNAQLASAEENQRRANAADLLGLSRGGDAVEMLRRQLDIHRQFEDGLKQLRDRGVAEDSAAWRQQELALRESRDRMLAVERDYQEQRLAMMADWRNGANAALDDYMAKAQNVAGMTRDAFANAFNATEDKLVEFVMTGKADFGSLVDSILADFVRMEARILLSKVFEWITGMFGVGSGGTALSGGSGAGIGSIGPFMANGGAWDSGVQKFANGGAFTNSIVSEPTLFKFAKGTGLMGEAGPEAIMPLRRSANGTLGVVAASQNAGITLIVENNVGPATSRTEEGMGPDGQRFVKLILDAAEDRVAGSIAGMGKVGRAAAGRFGLSPAGVPRG